MEFKNMVCCENSLVTRQNKFGRKNNKANKTSSWQSNQSLIVTSPILWPNQYEYIISIHFRQLRIHLRKSQELEDLIFILFANAVKQCISSYCIFRKYHSIIPQFINLIWQFIACKSNTRHNQIKVKQVPAAAISSHNSLIIISPLLNMDKSNIRILALGLCLC